MKDKKINKDDFIISNDIISLLLFENSILQKKINNENLTAKEQFFDSFIFSPSLILSHMIKLSNRRDSDKNHV